jgi:hypothetical protein
MLTCENASCKKNFEKPLKTLNLQVSASEPYDACPFCLTKIKAPQRKGDDQVNTLPSVKPKLIDLNANTVKCHFHPGYLSERTSKENIPDECLVCRDILDCMQRKTR